MEFISLPFARLLETIKRDGTLGGFNIIKIEGDDDFMFPKLPIYTVSTQYYFKKRFNYKIRKLTDLDNINIVIGQVIGFMYSKDFNKRKFSRYRVQSEEQLLKMLWLDRLDGIYITKELMEFYCKSLKIPLNAFYSLSDIGKKNVPLYLAFNKKNLKASYYASKFDEGLRALKATGQYETIIENELY